MTYQLYSSIQTQQKAMVYKFNIYSKGWTEPRNITSKI